MCCWRFSARRHFQSPHLDFRDRTGVPAGCPRSHAAGVLGIVWNAECGPVRRWSWTRVAPLWPPGLVPGAWRLVGRPLTASCAASICVRPLGVGTPSVSPPGLWDQSKKTQSSPSLSPLA